MPGEGDPVGVGHGRIGLSPVHPPGQGRPRIPDQRLDQGAAGSGGRDEEDLAVGPLGQAADQRQSQVKVQGVGTAA
jgi:hypothetical protein